MSTLAEIDYQLLALYDQAEQQGFALARLIDAFMKKDQKEIDNWREEVESYREEIKATLEDIKMTHLSQGMGASAEFYLSLCKSP